MSVTDTPSINRAERRKQHTRTALKAATLTLLLEQGYQAVTIKAITDHADVGYGTFYLHFADKDEVVWEVLLDQMEMQRQAVTDEALRLPFPVREYVGFLTTFQQVDKTRVQFAAMFGRNGSLTLNRRLHDYFTEVHFSNMRNNVYEARVDVPIPFLAQVATGALMQLLLWWVETPNAYTPQDMADMLFTTLYRQPPPRLGG
jgi:AcrR family transcriptional regulator